MIIHDRREFAKFEKEKMNAKWDAVSKDLKFSTVQQNLLFFRCLKNVFPEDKQSKFGLDFQ